MSAIVADFAPALIRRAIALAASAVTGLGFRGSEHGGSGSNHNLECRLRGRAAREQRLLAFITIAHE
jgi:hypothetical protein